MRSCLRSASPVSTCSLPRHRRVAFSFAVSFWFPAPDQIVLLPAESQCCSSVGLVSELSLDGGCCSSSVGFVSELSPATLRCPTPAHAPEPGVSVLGIASAGLPCSGLPGNDRSPSLALDVGALPEGQAHLRGTSGHVHGHGGPGVSSVPSDAPSTPDSSQTVPAAPCAQVPVDECSHACNLDLESAPFARAANHSGLPHPFTVFDEVHGARVFAGEAGWTRQDFVRAAFDNADLPGMPLVRFLRFEIVSLPTPQLVLTLDHGAIPHRGVVVDLQPLGGRVCVFDATNDASLADALIALQGRLAHEAAEVALDGILGGTCVCHVNGRIVSAWSVLSAQADTVQFFCLDDAPSWHVAQDAVDGTIQASGQAPTTASGSTEAIGTGPPRVPSQVAPSQVPITASAPVGDPSLPEFYTCFNFLDQRTLRRKEPGWTDEDCRQDALRNVWFAVPRAIVLPDPVEGYPLPQVLVFKATDLNGHAPVVLAFQGDRCEPLVSNVPLRSSVATFLSGFRHGPGMPGHGVTDVPGGCTCSARGVALSCFSPLPPQTYVVRIRRAISAEHPEQAPRVPPEPVPGRLVVPGTGGTDIADAARAAADAGLAANRGGRVHTCFDSLIGPRYREILDGWSPMRCLEDCESSAFHLPNPVGRLLVFPVEGLPLPQTIVTNRFLLSLHHSFVLDLRAVGQQVTAVTVPHGQMVIQALHAVNYRMLGLSSCLLHSM